MVGGVPTTMPVTSSAGLLINDETSDLRRTVSVVMLPDKKVLLMADIHQTEQCPAKVEARSFIMWTRSAKLTETWINNPDAPGPIASCK